jgi:hypothetical protein
MSYLNDIHSFAQGFSSFVKQGANLITSTGGQRSNSQVAAINQTMKNVLKQADEVKIRAKLKEIDDILTRECFFCGSFLVDMIDNDIEVKDEEDKEDDDAAEEKDAKSKTKKKISLVEDEWEIE